MKRRTIRRSQRTKVFNFYPGSFWFKRAGFIAIMFTIGFNRFLDIVQQDLVDQGEAFIAEAQSIEKMGRRYAGTADSVLTGLNINQSENTILNSKEEYINILGIKVKTSAAVEYVTELLQDRVREKTGNRNFKLPESTEVKEDIKKVDDFGKAISGYKPFFESAATVIKWTNVFIWFSIIGVAAPWLFLHMIYGTPYDRKFTFNWLLIAAIFNAITEPILTQLYEANKENLSFKFVEVIVAYF